MGVFFRKLLDISLESKICDPPLQLCVGGMGKRVEFSSLSHDPFDGFIKGREECFVILPEVRRSERGEVVVKALVLHKDYDPAG